MNDLDTSHRSLDDEFESILRQRMHQLADRAPTAVRQLDELVVGPAPAPRRRRAAGIGATIAALIGAVGVTTVALNGAGSGGAGTPSEAVILFVESLEREDVLGMIDVLDPAEVPALRAAVEEAASQAQRIDLVDRDFALGGVEGVEVDASDLVLETELVYDDVAMVSATSGSLSVAFDPTTFAFGAALSDVAGDEATVAVTDLADGGLELATVRRDGRWFVSISYTVAELARRSSGTDVSMAAPAVGPGFDSPEAAAGALFERFAAYDLAGAVATAAPGEGDAMLRYAALWLPGAQQMFDDAASNGLTLAVSDLGFEVTGEGDRRTVATSEFTITATVPASPPFSPLDPALPTVVYLASGAAYVVVPAGQPLPDRIDPAAVVTDTVPPESNNVVARPDGSVPRVGFIGEPVDEQPRPLLVQRSDGCTTWSGAATNELPIVATRGFEQVADDAWRSCESVHTLGAIFSIGTGGFTELPEVSTVQVDGRWYVSPVGTVAETVISVLRSVPDGASLFDTRLGSLLYGTDRTLAELIYVGRSIDEIDAACVAMVEADADGTIVAVVADPPLDLIRACGNGWAQSPVSEGVQAVEQAPTSVVTTDG